jgi:hypothetical protein
LLNLRTRLWLTSTEEASSRPPIGKRIKLILFVGHICLKVHKIENFFDSDFGICVISLLVVHK